MCSREKIPASIKVDIRCGNEDGKGICRRRDPITRHLEIVPIFLYLIIVNDEGHFIRGDDIVARDGDINPIRICIRPVKSISFDNQCQCDRLAPILRDIPLKSATLIGGIIMVNQVLVVNHDRKPDIILVGTGHWCDAIRTIPPRSTNVPS